MSARPRHRDKGHLGRSAAGWHGQAYAATWATDGGSKVDGQVKNGLSTTRLIVERGDALDQIWNQYEIACRRRQTSTALVRGVGGIGKTSLVAEALRRFAKDGAFTFAGRADEADLGMPYSVYRDGLRRLDRSTLLGVTEHVIDQLARSLTLGVTGSDRDSRGMLDQVVRDCVQMISMAASVGPVVVALEDLHVADEQSIVLHQLLSRYLVDLPVLFILTLRPGHDRTNQIERLVDRLAEDGQATAIDLQPLTREGVAALAADATGSELPDELVEIVLNQSRGNPFFVIEALNDLDAVEVTAEASMSVAAAGPPDERARERRILGRFFEPNTDVAAVAQCLSLFGRAALADLELVANLTGLPLEDVRRIFDRLLATQLLLPDGAGRFEFAHPILQELLHDRIGLAERQAKHRRIVDVLTSRQAAGVAVDVFDLARHATEAFQPGDEHCRAVMLQAADTAMAYAPLVAASSYERVVATMTDEDPRWGSTVALQAYSLHVGGQSGQAVAVVERALASNPRGPGVQRLALVAVHALYANGRLADALEVIERWASDDSNIEEVSITGQPGDRGGTAVMPRLKTKGPSLDLEMRALTLSLLIQLGRRAEAEAIFPEVLRAVRMAAPSDEMGACSLLLMYAESTGRTDVATELDSRLRLATSSLPPSMRADLFHVLAFAAVFGHRGLGAAERDLATAVRLNDGVMSAGLAGRTDLATVSIGWMRGRWPEIIERSRASLPELEQSGSATVLATLKGMVALILTDSGDYRGADRLVENLNAVAASGRVFTAVSRARVAVAHGQPELAAALLRERDEESLACSDIVMSTFVTDEWVAVERMLDNEQEAIRIARAGMERAALVNWPLLDLFAHRALAAATGDLDAARVAAGIAEAEGAPVELAKCRLLLAELGDDPAENLNLAYDEFMSIGALALRQRASKQMRAQGVVVPRRVRTRGRLTAAEYDLVRLVAAGMTNRQVADTLGYSTKTVESYLTTVYTKTGQPNRATITRAFIDGDLNVEA